MCQEQKQISACDPPKQNTWKGSEKFHKMQIVISVGFERVSVLLSLLLSQFIFFKLAHRPWTDVLQAGISQVHLRAEFVFLNIA